MPIHALKDHSFCRLKNRLGENGTKEKAVLLFSNIFRLKSIVISSSEMDSSSIQ
jgi:hypothetical protein